MAALGSDGSPMDPMPGAGLRFEGSAFLFLDVDGVLHPLNEKHLPAEADYEHILARGQGSGNTIDPETGVKTAIVLDGEFLPRCMRALKRIHCPALPRLGHYAHLRVSDDGAGSPQALAQSPFCPFAVHPRPHNDFSPISKSTPELTMHDASDYSSRHRKSGRVTIFMQR